MVIETISVGVVALYVGDKILAQIIKEEIWSKRLYYFIFPPTTYKSRLVNIIEETIKEFEMSHPYDNSNGMYPFYQSEIFSEHLSLFILFKQGTLDSIKGDFTKFPKIILPTQQDLEEFYSLFFKKVNADEILKSKFIEENYKSQIYEVSITIEEVKKVVYSIKEDTSATRNLIEEFVTDRKNNKLTIPKTLENLDSQVIRQLKKQLNSGKYLPSTFIEVGNQKDSLRYLCDSIFYSAKCFEETEILDFRLFNINLRKMGKAEINFDFKGLKLMLDEMNIENSIEIISNWVDYLKCKKSEIARMLPPNGSSRSEFKIEHRIEDFNFLKSKVGLITEMAGQGKTNFLCDFAENFLLKRGIPTVFLTGSEINANDIRLSILSKIFPDSTGYTFDEFLKILKPTCHDQKKYFIIIIDGINENLFPQLFSEKLESFIAELVEHDFIRIVISCRTEYYQKNFLNLDQSSFVNELQKITSLIGNRPDDNLKLKLFKIYFNHFKIKYNSISDRAYDQLVSNFLILRIFCEAYKNENLGVISDIYKEELFDKYYTLKSEEINKRLKENDEFNITGTFYIQSFISTIIKFMIENKTYVNVPLDSVIEDPKHKALYIRFLDENILVKRDIYTIEKEIFTSTEVVNFTFDEFRDFLISKYLVESLYKKSQDEFISFIESEISEKSPLLEGCSTFLFFISRKRPDEILNNIILKQFWFESVFSRCVFTLKDSQISTGDKQLLEKILKDNTKFNNSIVVTLVFRFNIYKYQILNIDFLFEILRDYNDTEYAKSFINSFGHYRWNHYQINQESFLSQINEILVENEVAENSPYHKLFELLIYMFLNENRWEVQSLYERYFFQNKEIGKIQLQKALENKNEKLLKEINQFISNYEINI